MIELKNVTKTFDTFDAVNNVSLTINTGSVFGLLGSNGAGKSTILRLLTGIYKQEAGDILIDGQNVYDNVDIKQRIFFINDETFQFASFTIEKLKNLYKSYYPNFSEEIFEKLRNKIKLPLNKKISTFSKGMKRQAIFIIALASGADYLMLDEAFDGLDPTMRVIVKHMLVDTMIDRNLTVVISSHNLKEMNDLCDTIGLLHDGKIVLSSEIDNVKRDIHKLQLAFSSETPELTRESLEEMGLEILHFEKNISVYHIIVKGDVDTVKAAFAVKKPTVFDIVPLTLEEIFIYELEVLGYDCNDINV
ncbi:MAG: ABC transporter ATP-binding protein [Ruminococcus sp.]|nr:ABC transporter ATP-binding protein [Ruminococcus sp.]